MIRSKGRRESEVQAAILAFLSLRKDLYFWRSNTGAGLAPSGRFMRSGVKGAADIQLVMAPTGRFVGIEVKRQHGGRLSEDQRRWGENISRMGGLYVVARSVEDVEKALALVWRMDWSPGLDDGTT